MGDGIEVVESEALASRLERIAEWQVGLRPADRADLRRAAAIVRSSEEIVEVPAPMKAMSRPTVIGTD
jgi:hypothetical protein